MPEQVIHAPATCDDCGKTYRVPRPDHTYRCKACGGTVRADEFEEEFDELEPEPTPEEQAERRREVTWALKRAYRWIDGVTWLYRLGALAYVLVTGLAVLALARSDVPIEAGILVVVMTSLMAVAMLMGAFHILFRPFVWTVTIASLATIVSIVHLVGPNPLGVAVFGSATLAVLSWAALDPTLRFGRLIAEHKDLYILHHASSRTRRSLSERTPEERHERLLRAMRNAALRAWKISVPLAVAVCVASTLGVYGVLGNFRPQAFSEALAEFESAWNGARIESVGELFDARVRVAEGPRLAGLLGGHGFAQAWPRVEGGTAREEDDRMWVDYDLGGVPMSASWVMDERSWTLVHVELPVPPLAPSVDRFLEALTACDAKGVSAFFSEKNQVKMFESLERSFERRGWPPLPEVLNTETSDHSLGEALVTLYFEKGEVVSNWYFRRDGRWGLTNLKFPKVSRKR